MTEDLAERFRLGGGRETRLPPVYGRISAGVAEDPDVRDLLLGAPREQRLPMLMFAVVHYLLLSGAEHPLARWYPTVGGRAEAAGDPYTDFRDFVLGRRELVMDLVASRSTQTNEIGRCAVLRPAWTVVAESIRAPLGLVELGSSAGLNLLLDRWAYSYSPDGPRYGDPGADVLVEAQSRGAPVPTLGPVDLASRIGIDAHPIRVQDDAAVRWLLACVWPEQLHRFQRLQAAIDVARTQPPQLVAGDIVATLPAVVAEVPEAQHLAVQNSWVLNYLPEPARLHLKSLLAEFGAARDLSWVSVESPEFAPGLDYPPRPDGVEDGGASVVVLSRWRDGVKAVRRLADCHPHGAWVRWW